MLSPIHSFRRFRNTIADLSLKTSKVKSEVKDFVSEKRKSSLFSFQYEHSTVMAMYSQRVFFLACFILLDKRCSVLARIGNADAYKLFGTDDSPARAGPSSSPTQSFSPTSTPAPSAAPSTTFQPTVVGPYFSDFEVRSGKHRRPPFSLFTFNFPSLEVTSSASPSVPLAVAHYSYLRPILVVVLGCPCSGHSPPCDGRQSLDSHLEQHERLDGVAPVPVHLQMHWWSLRRD